MTGATRFDSIPLEGSLAIAAERDPDDWSRIRDTAEEFGVTPEAVEDNEEDFEFIRRTQPQEAERLRQESPKTAEYLQNPDNSSLSSDDIDKLEAMERFLREADRPWYEFDLEDMSGLGSAMAESLRQGVRGAGLGAIEFDGSRAQQVLQAIMPMPTVTEVMKDLGRFFMGEDFDGKLDQAKEAAANDLIKQLQAGEKRIQDLTPEDLSPLEEAVRSATQSVVENLPGMALSAVTRSPMPSLASMGVLTGSRSYGSARAEGLDPASAARYAAIDASIEIATEALPTAALVKIFGNETGSFAKEALKFAISDVGGEQVAMIGQSLNAYAHELDEELEQAEGLDAKLEVLGERSIVTALATVIGGGAQVGIAKGAGMVLNRTVGRIAEETNRIQQSVVDQAVIEQGIVLAQSARTRERSPKAMQEFIDANGDRQVYIDAEQVQEAIDAGTPVPESAQKQVESGASTVQLSMGEFLANTEFAEQVKSASKLAEDRLSANELNDNPTGRMERVLNEANARLGRTEAIDKVIDRLTAELAATGRVSQNEAKLSLAPMESYLRRVATEYADKGVTPEEVVEKLALRVLTPEGRRAHLARKRARQSKEGSEEVTLIQPEFGDLELTEQVQAKETGEAMEVKIPAQRKWDRDRKRHEVLDAVARCVRGA